MEPKEKTFDFRKDTLTENFVQWIVAFARIPLQHYWGATWAHIAEKLGTIDGFERGVHWETKEPVTDEAVFTETDFCIGEDPVYADNPEEGYTDDASDLFVLIVEPHEVSNNDDPSEILFTFCRNNKVKIGYMGVNKEPWESRREKYRNRMGLPKDGTTLTWQETYDLLCRIAEDEQNSVPKCEV